jgi:hypothetical protein
LFSVPSALKLKQGSCIGSVGILINLSILTIQVQNTYSANRHIHLVANSMSYYLFSFSALTLGIGAADAKKRLMAAAESRT